MTETEGTYPADVRAGMILKVLKDSPMGFLQTAVLMPGMVLEYPERRCLLINRDDFWYFSELIAHHKLKLSHIMQDEHGNDLYGIEDSSPIILRTH